MMSFNLPQGDYQKIYTGFFGLTRYKRLNNYTLRPAYIEWYPCRESFEYSWKRLSKRKWLCTHFFFVCNCKNVSSFLNAIEKQLGIWSKTKVHPTNIPGICSVEPASFWSKEEIKMSLFTLFLRVGENYKGGNWKECLFANPYANDTKDAIEYFLSGNTVYSGEQGDWHRLVRDRNYKEVLRRSRLSWLKSLFLVK